MLRQFRSLGPKFVSGGLVIDDEPLLDDLAVAPVANLGDLRYSALREITKFNTKSVTFKL